VNGGPLDPYPPTLRGLWWRVRDALKGNRYVPCRCGSRVYIGPGPLEHWQCSACGRLLDPLSQGIIRPA
jgi:hypothetical protein